MAITACLPFFHAHVELEEAGQDDADGEEQPHAQRVAATVEKVDELAVAQLGHQVEHEISHGVVYPMEQ